MNLFRLFLRFCKEGIAVSAKVEETFIQVRVPKIGRGRFASCGGQKEAFHLNRLNTGWHYTCLEQVFLPFVSSTLCARLLNCLTLDMTSRVGGDTDQFLFWQLFNVLRHHCQSGHVYEWHQCTNNLGCQRCCRAAIFYRGEIAKSTRCVMVHNWWWVYFSFLASA